MTIKQQLHQDLTEALKSGDKLKVSTLRTVIGVIQTEEKSGKTFTEYDDTQVQVLLAKESKKRLETSEEFRKLGYNERADQEHAEAEILKAYLPEPVSEQQIRETVASIISGLENPTQKHMGEIMKQAKQQLGATTDGKILSEIVRSMLT